ncbi:signal peptide peptidase SppA [Acetobacteraceae bacterium KSS12]|uniref:Signal peptide peptidase SppA n=2 Tax=Rhizosaccharibacter radicis TaxID=2782605 RepID=A0ABT1VUB2_9PROT|nr:signal peptide peptidase SppA [Acetobacteraceae bacterium KSS12]
MAEPAHLARLRVDGLITDDSKRIDRLDAARRDPAVKGLLLMIDSPGGSVTGGEALHDAVARFARAKPVVVVMGGLGASAGYMIAVPAARIFASSATLTGSIGVLMQSPDVSGLLGKVGVSVDELVSGPLKGQPSVVKPLSPAGREMLQGVVMDLYNQFVDMVVDGRHMDRGRVLELADGRPYTGRQAVQLGLIDQLGDEHAARQWLAGERHLALDMPVRDLKPHEPRHWWQARMSGLLGDVLVSAIETTFGEGVTKTLRMQGVALDGPVALWHP